jgi:multidrug efflux system outer membrane protein
MTTLKSLAAVAVVIGLSGCAVGPDYRKPPADVPAKWSGPRSAGLKDGPADTLAWWKSFNDPILDSLVLRAVRSNYDLKIAEARVRQARAQQGSIDANLWPTVDATASFTRARLSKNEPLIGSLPLPPRFPFTNNDYKAGFDASWELDIFGGRRRASEAAKADVEGSYEARSAILVTLLAEVAVNYLELRGSQERLVIARQDIKLQSETLELARARYETGVTSDLDASQAAALLANIRSELPGLDLQVEQAIHRLAVLLGEEPGALVPELSAPAAAPSLPAEIPVGLPSDLLERRPDVRGAERSVAAETARVGVEKAEYYPKFSLNGNVGQESITTAKWFDRDSNFWSVGPSLQWRILDFGRVQSAVRLQDARMDEALASYRKAILTALEETEDALAAYAGEQLRHRAITEESEQDQRSLDLARARYAEGNAAYLNVLDASRSLNLARDRQAQSAQMISVDLVVLYKALGGGWETFGAPDAQSNGSPR